MKKFIFILTVALPLLSLLPVSHAQAAPDGISGASSQEPAQSASSPDTTQAHDTTETPASYRGGLKALQQVLIDNMSYPEDAFKQRIQGRVVVRFRVNADGKVEDITILKPVYPSLDAEALRVARLLTDWIPGTRAGKPVACYFTLPVNFQLPPEDLLRPEKAPVDSAAWQEMMDLATKSESERNYPYAKSYLKEAFYINPYDFLPIDRLLVITGAEKVKGADKQVLMDALQVLDRQTSTHGAYRGFIPVYEEIVQRMKKIDSKEYHPALSLASLSLSLSMLDDRDRCLKLVDEVRGHVKPDDAESWSFIYDKVPMYLLYIRNEPQTVISYLLPKIGKNTKDNNLRTSFNILSEAYRLSGDENEAGRWSEVADKLTPPAQEKAEKPAEKN